MTNSSNSENLFDYDEQAVAAAKGVMAAHIAALNASDGDAIAATLHFPHYRLAGSELKVWQGPEDYLSDFRARAGGDWHRSEWDALDVISASPDKVHLDVRFTRYRKDGSVLSQYRSIWVHTRIDGVWAAQLRSSFAP